jgi:hypothetical protein
MPNCLLKQVTGNRECPHHYVYKDGYCLHELEVEDYTFCSYSTFASSASISHPTVIQAKRNYDLSNHSYARP